MSNIESIIVNYLSGNIRFSSTAAQLNNHELIKVAIPQSRNGIIITFRHNKYVKKTYKSLYMYLVPDYNFVFFI